MLGTKKAKAAIADAGRTVSTAAVLAVVALGMALLALVLTLSGRKN